MSRSTTRGTSRNGAVPTKRTRRPAGGASVAPAPRRATDPAVPTPPTAVVAPTVEGQLEAVERAVPHQTRDERVARGKAARSEVPRESHAGFRPAADRSDPVSLLEGQGTTRVPELLPIRYGRMASSPFAYYRGAALPMAADLAPTPRSGLPVQLCGDAHLANFGVFASPERNLVFDLNDFDETLPGPWEWDVKRLAASLEIAGRSRDFPAQTRRRIVEAMVARYRKAMRAFAGMTALEVWYAHADLDTVGAVADVSLAARQRKALARGGAKARTKDNLGALSRFARIEDGEARLVAAPPLIVPLRDLIPDPAEVASTEQMLASLMRTYAQTLPPERRVLLERHTMVDMARKVVGVGSVGTRSWMILLLEDGVAPLFLQAKEAGPSVLEEYAGTSAFANCGERVVVGQRLMQAASDIFLGWVQSPGFDGRPRDFYIRQLRDWKGSAEVEQMVPAGMRAYGEICGWTLARAHARSGDRVAIAAYLGKGPEFDVAIGEFADAYADQNERDHAALVAAIASGRVVAEADV